MAQVTTLAAKDVSSEWNRAALTGHCHQWPGAPGLGTVRMGGPSPRADSNALSSQPSPALGAWCWGGVRIKVTQPERPT